MNESRRAGGVSPLIMRRIILGSFTPLTSNPHPKSPQQLLALPERKLSVYDTPLADRADVIGFQQQVVAIVDVNRDRNAVILMSCSVRT